MQGELHRAGIELGFQPTELAQVYDHRMVRTLILAARQLRAEGAVPRAQAPAPVAPAPTATRPGSKWPTGGQRNVGVALGEVRRATEQLQKTGSVDDAVAALRARRQLRGPRR
jgi:hypothetical protein